jgi:signal transduction histidine kinase
VLRPSKYLSLCSAARYFATLLLILLASMPVKALAQNALVLDANGFRADMADYVRFYEDRFSALTPEEALSLDLQTNFEPVPGNLIDFGFSQSLYWLRFTVRNGVGHRNGWKLSLDVPYIERIEVYKADVGSELTRAPEVIFSITDGEPFAARSEAYRNLVADVVLEADEAAEILVAYSSKQATQLPMLLESAEAFYSRTRAEDMHNWAMLALLMGMTIISTVYLAALGYRTAYFYGVYILLGALYMFHTDGYAFQFLWPNQPDWNRMAIAPIGLSMVASGTLFARSYVDAPVNHSRLNVVLLAAAAGSLTFLVLSIWALQYSWFKTGSLLFVVACAGLQLATGILAVRRGQSGAWLFLAGASTVIISVLVGIYGYLNPGLFNQDMAAHNARYALLFEGFAFSFAIFLHTQRIRRERDSAMRREIKTSTEKLALSEALRSAETSHKRAVELAEQRREQIASTAHDIKQPLMGLRIALMKMNESNPQEAAHITQSFDYLDELVRSNLEESKPVRMTKETAAVPELSEHDHGHDSDPQEARESFPVSVVLNNVTAMFREEARVRGVDLRTAPSNAMVDAAPVPVMRMVSNLVSNAVKYGDGGRVLLGCRRFGGKIRIEVHNTGAGISAAELERLQRPYERGKANGADGTGLGLSLVKDLAAVHGIQFRLFSVEGRGTVASLAVPLAP